jgi:hypothetical protein
VSKCARESSALTSNIVPKGQLNPFGTGLLPLKYDARPPVLSVPGAWQPSPPSQLHAGMGLRRHVEPTGNVPSETSAAGMIFWPRPSK